MANDTSFLVRCTKSDKARWESLAAASGMSFSKWVRSRLDAKAVVPGALVEIPNPGGEVKVVPYDENPPVWFKIDQTADQKAVASRMPQAVVCRGTQTAEGLVVTAPPSKPPHAQNCPCQACRGK